MRTVSLFFLLVFSSSGQVLLENWGCDSIVAATNTNPVVLTCNTPHGFPAGATWWARIYGGTASWRGINTRWHTNSIGSIQVSDTVITVVEAEPAAIGDNLTLGFCNNAPICGVEGTVTVTGKTANTLTVTRSSPAFHYASAFFLTPGSSDPSVILNSNRANYYTATATSPTQFSIPVDGTAFGSLTGNVKTRRVNGNGAPYGTDYTGANANVGTYSTVAGGVFTEYFPAITDPTNRLQVMAAVSGTSGFTNVNLTAMGNSTVCASGSCTINLASAYPAASSDFDRRLVVGSLVFLDGWADKRLEDGWLVTSVNADQPTSFTISVPGIPDGTYVGLAGTVGGFSVASRSNPNLDFQVADASGQWSFPTGYLQGYIKNGTWSSSINRLYTWMKMGNINMQRRANGGYAGTFGQYERMQGTNSNGGQYDEHWYYYFNPNWYDNQWIQVALNAHPTHQVGGGTWEYQNDPTFKGYIGNPGYIGDSAHLFDNLGRLYMNPTPKTVQHFLGVNTSLAPITLDTVTGEPDSSVSTVLTQWSPDRFNQVNGCLGDGDFQSGGFPPACTGAKGGGPGFEVTWNAPQFDSMSYEVRRSSTSMKTGAGFPSGLCNDGSTTCTSGNGDIVNWVSTVYTNVQWHSSNTSSTPPGKTYIGIRPRFTANFVSGNEVSPIWIGAETPMDMQTGDHVTISGVNGNTAANVTNAAIVGQIPQQIWYLRDPPGVTICAMTGAGVSPIRITTCSPHGISNGATVRVDAPNNSGRLPTGNTAAGGVWTASVVDATHIDLTGSTGNGTYNPSPYARVHGPGMLVSIVAASGTCTLTTSSAHSLLTGMTFTIANSRSAVLGPFPDTTEVVRRVSTVPSPTTLMFACAGVPDGTYDADPQPGDVNCGSSCFANALMTVRTSGAIAVAGTGNSNWTSGGMVVSSEPNRNFTEIPYERPQLGSPFITTSSLPPWTVNVAGYNQTVAAVGGTTPYRWSITDGNLPAGMSINSSTGAISGMPSTAGTSTFIVTVTGDDAASASVSMSIVINPPVSVTTATVPLGSLGIFYSQTLAANGGTGTGTWSITAGALPGGLQLATGTGIISGVPTAIGTFNFTVRVTDTIGAADSKDLSILVQPGPPAISTSSLPASTVGVAYSQTLTATGGAAPYTWAVSSGSLPHNLSLNSSTGVISGTPDIPFAAPFTITVTGADMASASAVLAIAINPGVLVTTSTLPPATVSIAYSQTLAATGGTGADTWSISSGALPEGLLLNANTGVISGTATATGTFHFTVLATDSVGAGSSKELIILVQRPRGTTVRGVTLRGVTGH